MLVFFILLCFLPSIAPGGISQDEMDSAVAASSIHSDFIVSGNIIDLPYRVLQRISIATFGLSLYSIKLPSIIISVLAALFIVLLLNRWFKSDVAIVGSFLTTLSTAFLFLAGSGTPTIMYIFWLAEILWLGSKIVGNENTHPMLVISFFFSLALSMYTLRNVRIFKLPVFAALMPALMNGIFVGFEIDFFFINQGSFDFADFLVQGGLVAIGELAVLFVLGLPLCRLIEVRELDKKLHLN